MRSKPVYRSIMEKKIGRSLNRYEVVHHLNGNHDDNRIENLVVVSRAEHARLHHNMPPRGHLIRSL